MTGKFEILTNEEEVNQLMAIFFCSANRKLKKVLKLLSNQKGWGEEVVFVSFKDDLDEYDMAQLPKPLDDRQIIVEFCFPAVEVDQIAYLDFKTFYNYLVDYVKKEIEKNIEDVELLELLKDVKSGLEI